MFQAIGAFVSRFWLISLALWIIALGLGWTLAPTWNDTAVSGEVQALPSDAPSVVADNRYQEAFPDSYSPSNIVLVFTRDGGEINEGDLNFIDGDLNRRVIAKALTMENSPVLNWY